MKKSKLTEEDVAQMLVAVKNVVCADNIDCYCGDDYYNKLAYYTMFFVANTGLRWNELFDLKWEDIDFDKMVVTVNVPDYVMLPLYARKVKISADVIDEITHWKEFYEAHKKIKADYFVNSEDLVFPNRCGNFMRVSLFNRILRKLSKKCNLPDGFLFAEFRRAFLTNN